MHAAALLISLLRICLLAAQAQQARAAQESESSSGTAGALQKAVQNPVASLISVPVQNSSNFGMGPFFNCEFC